MSQEGAWSGARRAVLSGVSVAGPCSSIVYVYVMGVGRKRVAEEVRVLSVRLPVEVYEALAERALRRGVPVSTYLREQLSKLVGA